MSVVYMVTAFFVIALLLSIPLFPFWKAHEGLRMRHANIWNSRGPFSLSGLITNPALLGGFLAVLAEIEKDESLRRTDLALVKWAHLSQEIVRMLPRSFPGQVGCFILFLYFTHVLTSLLTTPFRH